ncbi:MAG TPA: ABC transporter permease subunit [Acidobacteriota bacterium]|nr:ABC transporter permease subunit [Acidobacteriota bacterium]
MFGTLVKKEFLTNLAAPRFIIGFILCLVLIPFSILINISSFRERAGQYRIDREATEKAAAEVRVFSAVRPEIVLPPEPLSVFGKGVSDQVGNRVKIQLGDKPMLAAGKTAAGDNPFLASFFAVDFVDIAAIIFALLALLFSYDAFSREREDGTLKLQMANSLSRSTALAGKLVGILATLLPVVIFSFLLSGLLILFSRDVAFAAADWGRIVLLFAASLVYLAVFVFIGLLVSTRSRSSVTSLVVCLFVWVLLVFLVPAVSANFAGSFTRIQSRDNLERVLKDIDRQREEAISAAFKARGVPEGWSCWWCNSDRDGYMETYGNPPEEFENFRRRASISEPIRIAYADRKGAVAKAYVDSLARQARTADRLSFVSPAGLFRAVAAAVCRTDLRAHERLMDRTRQYREAFVGWLKGKDIFASFRWITPADPATFRTEDQSTEARTGGEFKTAAELDAWATKQTDARARWLKLSKVHVPGDSPDDFPYLDLSDMPRFEVPAASLVSGLEPSVLFLGGMLIEAIILFALGYVAFIRYDVR